MKVFILALMAAAVVFPFAVSDPYYQNLAILALMAAQIGAAWNIVGGYAGQASLGHAAFYGLGAYTSTLLLINFGINPWLGMLIGGVVAAASSALFGWSCFRLKGHYFTMATIAVAEIVQIMFTNWKYAGSAVGLTLPMDKQGLEHMVFASKQAYYWLALGLLALTLFVTWLVERSYLGFYFRAIKDEPDAARSVGVNIARYKQIALLLSAFFTALGGSLYAQKELYIDPGSVLHTGLSIKMALVAILGGVGTLFGPIVGSVVLTFIDELTRSAFGGSGRGTDVIIYATLIVVISVFYPSGILGWFRDRAVRRKAMRQGATPQAANGMVRAASPMSAAASGSSSSEASL